MWCKNTTADVDVDVVADGGGERRDMGLKSSVYKSTTADVDVVADGGGERRDVGQKSNVVKEHHGRCGEERRDVSLKSSVV